MGGQGPCFQPQSSAKCFLHPAKFSKACVRVQGPVVLAFPIHQPTLGRALVLAALSWPWQTHGSQAHFDQPWCKDGSCHLL